MIGAEFGTGQVFWSLLWFFMFALWFALVVTVLADIIRSSTLSGWGKALWALGILILPLLGVILYTIVMTSGDDAGEPRPNTSGGQPPVSSADYAQLSSLAAAGALTPAEYQRALAKMEAEAGR